MKNALNLSLKFKSSDLAKEKGELAYRVHRARGYEVGEYKEKVSEVRKYMNLDALMN
ncbi:hypothetical protein [Bartonella taylorii]|uniref:hypothetical protein n=1 Tax=Bartonella taylorii TaxID=33046 RepID=UPI001FED53A7|nr:hypothetical protein [Bartonella taylorii]